MIYEVEFPFEVNSEEGAHEFHAATLAEALRLARETPSTIHPDYLESGDIVVSRCRVVRLTRESFCRVLDGQGGWLAERVEVRRIPYTAPPREE